MCPHLGRQRPTPAARLGRHPVPPGPFTCALQPPSALPPCTATMPSVPEPRCFGRLVPPPGASSSGLTAWATDDLEAEPWVMLYCQRQPYPPAAFWYVVDQLTVERHWNRTIYTQSTQRSEHVHTGTLHITDDGPYVAPPPPRMRVHALRRLLRKTPAPIGGAPEDEGRAYDAYEWTSQWIDCASDKVDVGDQGHGEDHHACHDLDNKDLDGDRHVACFGLSLPEKVVTPDNPRALRYWPFQYPKARCYRFVYERWRSKRATGVEREVDEGEENGDSVSSEEEIDGEGEWVLKYEVVPLGDEARSPRQFETLLRHALPAAKKMVTHLRKRMKHFDVDLGTSTYVKRVTHDALIDEARFRRWYDAMKLRHAPQIQHWLETPGLLLKPYEELAIAAYLCGLWEAEREDEGTTKKQTFVDGGCGNGLLVYLLLLEGHSGRGYDGHKRPIWSLYPQHVQDALHHQLIDPKTFDCSPYDWIVANHADELLPWTPVMAARAQCKLAQRPVCADLPYTLAGDPLPENSVLRRAYPRFIVIPCCFYDFDGRKLAFGHMRRTISVRAPHGMGKYEQYYRWIDKIMRTFGFTVEYENLRIPSTKYVSLVGRFVQYEERTDKDVIKEMTSLVMLDATVSRM